METYYFHPGTEIRGAPAIVNSLVQYMRRTSAPEREKLPEPKDAGTDYVPVQHDRYHLEIDDISIRLTDTVYVGQAQLFNSTREEHTAIVKVGNRSYVLSDFPEFTSDIIPQHDLGTLTKAYLDARASHHKS